jgi:hypothetical protein
MVGVNKLAQAIESVGFVACQFILWVVPEEWFNSEQEPDFGEQAIVVCFLFAVTYLVGTTLDIYLVQNGCHKMYSTYYVFCNGYRKMYSIYYAFCDGYRKMYSIYYAFCNGHHKMHSIQ